MTSLIFARRIPEGLRLVLQCALPHCRSCPALLRLADCKKRKHAEGGKDTACAATDEVKKLKETHEQQIDDMRQRAAQAGFDIGA
jgi:hypothetical protein